MKIENIDNQQNFKAIVDPHFVKSVTKFYSNKGRYMQYEAFMKTVNKFETFGDKHSIVQSAVIENNGVNNYLLVLRNKHLDKKQGLILKMSNKFDHIAKFFANLTDNAMLEYEKLLAKK